MTQKEYVKMLAVVLKEDKIPKKGYGYFIKGGVFPEIYLKSAPNKLKEMFDEVVVRTWDVDSFLKERGLPLNYKEISYSFHKMHVEYGDFTIEVPNYKKKVPRKETKAYLLKRTILVIPIPGIKRIMLHAIQEEPLVTIRKIETKEELESILRQNHMIMRSKMKETKSPIESYLQKYNIPLDDVEFILIGTTKDNTIVTFRDWSLY